MSASGAVDVTAIIPAFNEGKNVTLTVDATIRTLRTTRPDLRWQLVVVDDGSSDDTFACAEAAKAHESVDVVRHRTNQGLGAAIRSGFAASRGEFVTVVPADGEVPIEEALELLGVAAGADLVISRRTRESRSYRDVLSAGFHWLQRAILGFDPSDMDGIFVVRRSILAAMPLASSTGMLQFELLMRAMRNGHSILRHGITRVHPRLSGESKVTNIRTMTRVLADLVRLRARVNAGA